MDLRVWQEFLAYPSVFCRPFTNFKQTLDMVDVDLYTDASRNFSLGCAGVCTNQWFFVDWELQVKFLNKYQPSIEYLELYAATVGVVLWISKFKNQKIYLFCDNQAVVNMINNTTSGCRNCMVLIRTIVLQGLKFNVLIKAKYVRSKQNCRADALSRKKFKLFHRLVNYKVDLQPCQIPHQLHPLSKLWLV